MVTAARKCHFCDTSAGARANAAHPSAPASRRYKSRCRLFSIIHGLNLTTSTAVPPRHTSTPHFRTHTETRASIPTTYIIYIFIIHWRGDARQTNIITREYSTWSAVVDTTRDIILWLRSEKGAYYIILIAQSGCVHSYNDTL